MVRRWEGGRRRIAPLLAVVLLAVFLVVTACGSDESGNDGAAPSDGSVGPDGAVSGGDAAPVAEASTGEDGGADGSDGTSGREGPSAGGPVIEHVPLLEGGRVVEADLESHRVELEEVADGVSAVVLPRPDYAGNPWSQWGQGIVLDDGRVISAMGDHLGPDGNSFLFVYDPGTGSVSRFADVLSALPHQDGSWGYGKIHSQMVDPGGGGIYFTTYWGTRRELRFGGGYHGDVLFRLDSETLELQPVAVPVEDHGVPSLASDGSGLLFGEAVDPTVGDASEASGGFFVYDVTAGETATWVPDPDHTLFRSILVDRSGSAWFARDGGDLFRYDPAIDEVTVPGVDLGGGALRAVTGPTADGTVYAVTQDPPELVAFRTGGDGAGEGGADVRSLGPAEGYTASLAVLPDESGFLYVPGAHGDSSRWGTPLISVDGETGEQTVLVELADLGETFDLVLGGTYSVTVDPDRNVAHIAFNAGTDPEEPWGEIVFVVVELP